MSATFSIPKTVLARSMARIVDTAPRRCPKPILQNCRVSINGHVTIEATDLERYHVEDLTSCVSDHSGDISVLVDARKLRKLVTSSKSRQLTLSIDDNGDLTVGAATIDSDLRVDDFPSSSGSSTGDLSITLPSSDVARIIERTVFATDFESSRYTLAGLLIETDGQDYFRLVGTDARRLATDYVGTPTGEITTAIWHGDHARSALKALKRADSCTFTVSERDISLTCYGPDGTSAWIFRQIEGRFPEWRKVFPSDHMPVCQVDANDLREMAQGVVDSTCDIKEDDVCCATAADICAGDDVLSFSASHAKYFSHCDVLSESTKLEARFDAKYLRDFAKACKDSVLTIHARDYDAIYPERDKQGNYPIRIECSSADYIVMPLA